MYKVIAGTSINKWEMAFHGAQKLCDISEQRLDVVQTMDESTITTQIFFNENYQAKINSLTETLESFTYLWSLEKKLDYPKLSKFVSEILAGLTTPQTSCGENELKALSKLMGFLFAFDDLTVDCFDLSELTKRAKLESKHDEIHNGSDEKQVLSSELEALIDARILAIKNGIHRVDFLHNQFEAIYQDECSETTTVKGSSVNDEAQADNHMQNNQALIAMFAELYQEFKRIAQANQMSLMFFNKGMINYFKENIPELERNIEKLERLKSGTKLTVDEALNELNQFNEYRWKGGAMEWAIEAAIIGSNLAIPNQIRESKSFQLIIYAIGKQVCDINDFISGGKEYGLGLDENIAIKFKHVLDTIEYTDTETFLLATEILISKKLLNLSFTPDTKTMSLDEKVFWEQRKWDETANYLKHEILKGINTIAEESKTLIDNFPNETTLIQKFTELVQSWSAGYLIYEQIAGRHSVQTLDSKTLADKQSLNWLSIQDQTRMFVEPIFDGPGNRYRQEIDKTKPFKNLMIRYFKHFARTKQLQENSTAYVTPHHTLMLTNMSWLYQDLQRDNTMHSEFINIIMPEIDRSNTLADEIIEHVIFHINLIRFNCSELSQLNQNRLMGYFFFSPFLYEMKFLEKIFENEYFNENPKPMPTSFRPYDHFTAHNLFQKIHNTIVSSNMPPDQRIAITRAALLYSLGEKSKEDIRTFKEATTLQDASVLDYILETNNNGGLDDGGLINIDSLEETMPPKIIEQLKKIKKMSSELSNANSDMTKVIRTLQERLSNTCVTAIRLNQPAPKELVELKGILEKRLSKIVVDSNIFDNVNGKMFQLENILQYLWILALSKCFDKKMELPLNIEMLFNTATTIMADPNISFLNHDMPLLSDLFSPDFSLPLHQDNTLRERLLKAVNEQTINFASKGIIDSIAYSLGNEEMKLSQPFMPIQFEGQYDLMKGVPLSIKCVCNKLMTDIESPLFNDFLNNLLKIYFDANFKRPEVGIIFLQIAFFNEVKIEDPYRIKDELVKVEDRVKEYTIAKKEKNYNKMLNVLSNQFIFYTKTKDISQLILTLNGLIICANKLNLKLRAYLYAYVLHKIEDSSKSQEKLNVTRRAIVDDTLISVGSGKNPNQRLKNLAALANNNFKITPQDPLDPQSHAYDQNQAMFKIKDIVAELVKDDPELNYNNILNK